VALTYSRVTHLIVIDGKEYVPKFARLQEERSGRYAADRRYLAAIRHRFPEGVYQTTGRYTLNYYLGSSGTSPARVFQAKQPMVEGTRGMLDELHMWAAALKTIRTNEAA